MRELTVEEGELVTGASCADLGDFGWSVFSGGVAGVLSGARAGLVGAAAGGIFWAAMGGAMYLIAHDGPCS